MLAKLMPFPFAFKKKSPPAPRFLLQASPSVSYILAYSPLTGGAVCVLKYISYISYIRFFEGLKMPYLQGFSNSFANGYPPICEWLPPFSVDFVRILYRFCYALERV